MIIDDLSRYETEEWSDGYVPDVVEDDDEDHWDGFGPDGAELEGIPDFFGFYGADDIDIYDDGPDSYAEPSGDW